MTTLEVGPAERTRWYILIAFSLLSASQSNTWFTFSSVPDQIEDYYHLKKPSESGQVNAVIDLLLNWGPICFIPTTPFSAYLLSLPMTGFRYTVKLSAILVFFGTFIRCIPTILDQIPFINYNISSSFWQCLVFLHFGQILNAIAGPLVMAPPSKLSVIWFKQTERATATAISALSNTFGYCFAFLIGPLIVTHKDDIPYLLYLDLILSFMPFICIMLYFPSHPEKLPSIAAKYALKGMNVTAENMKSSDNKSKNAEKSMLGIQVESESISKIAYKNMDGIDESNGGIDIGQENKNEISFMEHFKSFLYEVHGLFRYKSALIVVIVGGLEYGIFASWASVLQDMIGDSTSIDLNETEIGFIGFNISGMSVIGGFIIGPIADKYFNKNLKKLIFILFFFAILILCILFFVLPSPFDEDSMFILNKDSSNKNKIIVINILVAIMGIFEGALIPLFFELSADIAYPISEGTSATMIVFINNVVCLICIGIGSWMSTKWETFFALIICLVCVMLMCIVKEQYNRPS
eukprot:343824_1